MTFDDLLVRSASAALLATATWLAVLLLAVTVEAVTAGRVRASGWTGAPDWLRRPLLVLATGAVAACGIHAPAATAADQAGRPTGVEAVTGLRLPDRPVGGLGPAPERASPPGQVTVRPGDSLWRIVQRLAPGAGAAATQDAVTALHRHNRAVIGDDPDLLHPGQRLRVPADLDEQETT